MRLPRADGFKDFLLTPAYWAGVNTAADRSALDSNQFQLLRNVRFRKGEVLSRAGQDSLVGGMGAISGIFDTAVEGVEATQKIWGFGAKDFAERWQLFPVDQQIIEGVSQANRTINGTFVIIDGAFDITNFTFTTANVGGGGDSVTFSPSSDFVQFDPENPLSLTIIEIDGSHTHTIGFNWDPASNVLTVLENRIGGDGAFNWSDSGGILAVRY